jgi:carboxymethylenebutenolidase
VEGRDVAIYLSEGAPGAPGVLVIQEYWGIVDQIKDVADRLAAEGFTAAVPDLYGGEVNADGDAAMAMMMSLDVSHSMKTLEATIDLLQARGSQHVGGVGFCMGGGLALLLATESEKPQAVVVFYGAIPWADRNVEWSDRAAPVMLHYGTEDPWATPEFAVDMAESATASGGRSELFLYEGAGHAFLDDTREESYDHNAAALAWRRTVDFLRAELSPSGDAIVEAATR